MVLVYKARTPADAAMLLHWLERNGIPGIVRGGMRSLPQIPIGKNPTPSVWVGEVDEVRALQAIKLFQSPQLVHPQWVCPRCDEVNEANFGSCWSCEADRPGLAS